MIFSTERKVFITPGFIFGGGGKTENVLYSAYHYAPRFEKLEEARTRIQAWNKTNKASHVSPLTTHI